MKSKTEKPKESSKRLLYKGRCLADKDYIKGGNCMNVACKDCQYFKKEPEHECLLWKDGVCDSAHCRGLKCDGLTVPKLCPYGYLHQKEPEKRSKEETTNFQVRGKNCVSPIGNEQSLLPESSIKTWTASEILDKASCLIIDADERFVSVSELEKIIDDMSGIRHASWASELKSKLSEVK